MLLGFVLLIIGITIFQERRTEYALAALRRLSSPRALVIRDGRSERIAGRDVVEGDLVVLADGDRVPADGVLLEAVNLLVDESILTGESVPVRKIAREGERIAEKPRPGGDGLPYVFSGTLVVKGEGTCRVTATGVRSEMGKIGGAIRTSRPGRSRLQQETGRIVRRITLAGLVLCGVVVTVYGLTRHDWVNGFLTGLTLAMAVLPEEYPVVLTVYLALGAWRISRKNVLTRRMPAVETLGSATVLCVDKTGTLTLNEIRIAALYANGSFFRVGKLALGAIPDLPSTPRIQRAGKPGKPSRPHGKGLRRAHRNDAGAYRAYPP
jgi:ATPase, P-type (transporting), HAD superfamily, subfamily IC